jgi:hypothetical protein
MDVKPTFRMDLEAMSVDLHVHPESWFLKPRATTTILHTWSMAVFHVITRVVDARSTALFMGTSIRLKTGGETVIHCRVFYKCVPIFD